jgi:hypothetical protein
VILVLTRPDSPEPPPEADEVLPLDDTPSEALLDAILAADLVVIW